MSASVPLKKKKKKKEKKSKFVQGSVEYLQFLEYSTKSLTHFGPSNFVTALKRCLGLE